MRIKRTSFIPSLLLCLTHLTYADQNTKNNPNDKESTTLEDHSDKKSEDTASAWKGSNAQLGITANTGNTQAIDGNTALNVNYAKRHWKNIFQFTTQIQKNGGSTTSEKFYAQDQMNFSFGDAYNQFIFLNTNGTVDKLSPYTFQGVLTTGYGLDLINNNNFKWSVQAGPGFRTNRFREQNLIENKYATTAQTNIDWAITPTDDLTETFSAVWGEPSNYYKSVSTFTNKITSNNATNGTFTIDYYDKIPPSSTQTFKTNTTTAISLVYNFG